MPLILERSPSARARVAQHADVVDVPEGKRLARGAEPAHEFFVIRKSTGEVGGAAKSKTSSGLKTLGAIGVPDEERFRKAAVTARSPTNLVVMSGHDLQVLSPTDPRSSTICCPPATTASAVKHRRLRGSRHADHGCGRP
jgi:hypothetical protein